MRKQISMRRVELQDLWKSGKSIAAEMDRVSLCLEDSTEEYIHARMVFRNIHTDEHWEAETRMEPPLFEAFGFGESDGEDCFACKSVAPVEWQEISYEEIQTLAATPPRLSLKP